MSREIRKVPANWEHPKKEDGSYVAMCDGDFGETYKEWEEELKQWYKEQEEFEKGKEFGSGDNKHSKKLGNTYEDWAGEPPSPPNPYRYMPKGDWFQLFEGVSEGTPLSPAFATEKELIDWLTNNEDFWGNSRTREAAEFIVEKGYCPSGVMTGGKFYNPEEQHKIK